MKSLGFLLLSFCLAGSATAQWATELDACSLSGLDGLCGSLLVPENPAEDGGRKLEIRVFVLPAFDTPSRVADPLLVLEGGPGASVLSAAPLHASTFARLRRTRDLIFVEQRGTGESAALECGLGALARLEPRAVRECRDRLQRNADLRFYGTTHAVGDLLRALDTLDVGQVNVFGVSYGTRTALELARRHPERIRSVSLLGTYAPGRNAVLDAPAILDRSLELLVEACSSDPACDEAFPEVRASLRQLEERLTKGELEVSRLELASTLRLMLFYPLTTRQVPGSIVDAARGELGTLRAVSSQTSAALGGITDGAFLSLLCSEDVARLTPEAVDSAGDGSLLRGGWGRALIDACAEWTLASVPKTFHSPLPEATPPILSLTGELDPSMPPSYGEELAESLPRARHLTLPEAQHGLLGMRGVGCVVELLEDFIETGSTDEIDVGCLAQLERPPFAVP